MKFSIEDFFCKCDQIGSFLKKYLMENFIFCTLDVDFNDSAQLCFISKWLKWNSKGSESHFTRIDVDTSKEMAKIRSVYSVQQIDFKWCTIYVQRTPSQRPIYVLLCQWISHIQFWDSYQYLSFKMLK